nr:hypothetical protein BaRGS_029763 [Batillaria attramentaria]
MSRLYAALWHDGKDPFVFRVSNLSERKPLLVDGVMLRHGDEAEVKDGSVLILDFLQFKAKVCAGDLVAFCYQVSFVKNAVMSPVAAQPPGGKVLMPRPDCARLFGYPYFPCPDEKAGSLDSTGQVLNGLLNTLRKCSLDSGDGKCVLSGRVPGLLENAPDDVGVEYELEENEKPMKPPQQPLIEPQSGLTTEPKAFPSAVKKDVDLSCWFNLNSPPLDDKKKNDFSQQDDRLVSHAQQMKPETECVCPSCKAAAAAAGNGGGKATMLLQAVGVTPTTWSTLPDMVASGEKGRRSPVEHTAEWDTDDPNINCYM